MARRWTRNEERFFKKQLQKLYIVQNKTIGEIAIQLKIVETSVFDRLRRLKIKTIPEKKLRYRNQRNDVQLPKRSAKLAEFFGIMLGDGHVAHFQTFVTLGTKELNYVRYVQTLMQELFKVKAKISLKKSGHREVYIGSTLITKWLKKQGMV